MLEEYCLADTNILCVADPNFVVSVVFPRIPKVIAWLGVRFLYFYITRHYVYFDCAPQRRTRIDIVVVLSIEDLGSWFTSTLDLRSRFSWCSAWRRIQHHIYREKSSSVPTHTNTKWSLNVWIVFPAMFLLWSLGGTSWNFILFFVIAALYSVEYSLSKRWSLGLNPRCFKQSTRV